MLRIFLAYFLVVGSVSAQKLNANVFGYIEGYAEKVGKSPTRSGGTTTTPGTHTRTENPHEFDTPNVTLMVKADSGIFSGFLNLNLSDSSSLEQRNAWVEAKLKGNYLKLRTGKLYRPFGLYNERLDAVPTYIGIEPPELFDNDHLLVTRTTDFMLHGSANLGIHNLRYALTTGEDERFNSEIPIGGDVRFNYLGEGYDIIIGSSFYFSNLSKYNSNLAGGVERWMKSDSYNVKSLYVEFTSERWKIQTAYFQASHDGVRNGSYLSGTVGNAGGTLNQRQIDRLCAGNMSTCADSTAKYDVTTWYLRAGYTFFSESIGEITPYIQWDYYENPETIANKSFGGDNEAGLADDGKFTKHTIGTVFRPTSKVAIKTDVSNHSQKIDGKTQNYAEVRGSFSYIWTL